ncbi:hypothetical protein JOC24_006499 [Streptomyces sp. HB132]|nr:hypothetical protein [Streptomyces sp. HB132]MBM7443051.1 hypothetical protein [Streptomyces sp. HB132]
MRRPLRAHSRRPPEGSGRQLGDPARADSALLCVQDAPDPLAWPLGSDALRLVRAGREAVDCDLDSWKDLTLSADFPQTDEKG